MVFRLEGKKSHWVLVFIFLVGIVFFTHNKFQKREFFGIKDYKPSSFFEHSVTPFFFSIDGKIKYGSAIDAGAPTVFENTSPRDRLTEVRVSPNQNSVAIVSDGNLYVATIGSPPILLLREVDNNVASHFGVGQQFYKYPSLQWDTDSRDIYIVRDIKQDVVASQSFSLDAALLKVDSQDPKKAEVIIADFRSSRYFQFSDSALCFNYAMGNGKLIWKCSSNGRISQVESIAGSVIRLSDGTSISGRSFFPYSPQPTECADVLSFYGFAMKRLAGMKTGLFSRESDVTPILLFEGGTSMKGEYVDGIGRRGCSVLPGGRYALLPVSLDNFKGELLIDGLTGQYRELPKKSRAYTSMVTDF